MTYAQRPPRARCFVQFTLASILLAGGSLAGPQTGVIRTMEFENEHVRIQRVTIPALHAAAMHSHARPALEVFLTDDHVRETLADGTKREWRSKAGEVAWVGPVTHRVENLRDGATELISIEFKALPPSASRTEASQSAREFENEWINQYLF